MGARPRPIQLLLLIWSLVRVTGEAGAGTAPALPQEAYVWQRAWTPAVVAAVRECGPELASLVPLAAEVAWRHGEMSVVRVPLDFAALKATGRSVGLALRIGPHAGPFHADDALGLKLGDLAATLLAAARAGGLEPRELQIDFDCAAAQLTGYQTWVTAWRARIAPTPLVITALPSWLGQPGMAGLAGAVDGWILQVHSLERPKSAAAPFTLCDPAAARRAVAAASRLGRPFRVALPTYGYAVAFDARGEFFGLAAEGPARDWPAGAQVKEVRSRPEELAELVRAWTASPPPNLRGLIWYRLPNAEDGRNWNWPTLRAVMAGRAPREQWRAEARTPEPGLTEIWLHNDGETGAGPRPRLRVSWTGARMLAADGLAGYAAEPGGPNSLLLTFPPAPSERTPAPGAAQMAGWLRFNVNPPITLELLPQ